MATCVCVCVCVCVCYLRLGDPAHNEGSGKFPTLCLRRTRDFTHTHIHTYTYTHTHTHLRLGDPADDNRGSELSEVSDDLFGEEEGHEHGLEAFDVFEPV